MLNFKIFFKVIFILVKYIAVYINTQDLCKMLKKKKLHTEFLENNMMSKIPLLHVLFSLMV